MNERRPTPPPLFRGPGHGGPHGMGLPGERPKDFRGTFRRLMGVMRPQRGILLLVTVLAVLSTLFAIAGPRYMGEATTLIYDGFIAKLEDPSAPGIDFAAVANIIVILLVLYVSSALLVFLMQYLMAGVSQRIAYDLREMVNAKLTRLPLQFFDRRGHGDTLSRVVNDVDTVGNTLQMTITQAFTSVITLLGVLGMMLSISGWLTLIALATFPLAGILTAKVAKRSQQHFRDQQRSLGELNTHVEEMFTGHAVVRAFGRERESVERFGAINEELYDAGWKAHFVSGLIMPLMHFVNNVGYLLLSVVGAIFVLRQAIQVGDVQAFIQYSRQMGHPIGQVANIANVIQSTIAAAERVFELLDEEEMVPDPATPAELPAVKGHVRFEDVHFGYSPDAPLYTGLTFEAPPGSVVAIVGPTGAGKTTLVNLLLRFYEIDRGSIRIDDVDIRSLRRSDLHRLFGMVLQQTWLFHGTIRENIAYGRKGATEEEIVAAAEAAYADAFIRTLPNGYDTVLNEEATNLSQGQKQLLTIARAILADPPILILDEATSSVDSRTELLLQQAMNRLMRGRTSFVIAHRLSTIRNADLILVMDEGRIVEQGRHDELLAAGGFYAELYRSQFRKVSVEEAV